VSRNDAAADRLRQAEASLQYADQRLRETVIRAPFDGVVSRRFVDPGEPVTSMPVTQLVEVQEVGVLELLFSLPQDLLRSVRPGTEVEFEVEGMKGSGGTGKIDVVFPAMDESTRSFRCRVLVDNAEGKYRPGLLARVRAVEEEIKDAVVVPRQAVAETAAGWQVWASGGDGPALQPVRVGAVTEEEVEILEGLKAGDRVLFPGK